MRKFGTFIIRLSMNCLWLLLVLMALANARCATTTHASVGSPAAVAWLSQHESDRATVTFRDRPEWMPLEGNLSFDSDTSPPQRLLTTQFRLDHSGEDRVISFESVRDVEVVRHGRGILDGALVGAGAGLLVGVSLGLSMFRSCGEMNCDAAFHLRVDASMGAGFSGLGAVVGALAGAAIGHRDILTF